MLVTAHTPHSSMAGSIIVVNESSLISAPGGSFTATIGDGKYGPELIVTGPVAERTANGERLVEAIVEIIVADADGGPLWSGSWPAKPGVDLDWRVAVKPYGTSDSALIGRVSLRDREVSTIEAREHVEREARERAEREARQREREARQREETARAEARRREHAAEAKRQAAIRAHGWPKRIEAAVVERKVMPGMTPEQVTLAWGRPRSVNQTIRASGVSEQWVYSISGYVYFENGRVTAIQTSR
jgi:hypothetical protein